MTKKKNLIHNEGSISQEEEYEEFSLRDALINSVINTPETRLEKVVSENMKKGAGSHKISITIDMNDEGVVIGLIGIEVDYTNFKERAIKESEHCVRFKSKVN